ncbi:hypothetical protein HELRODRAFT_179596 [Helobdella robusta]|uniref:AP complex subunit sigma n=1 Tax=Helobdella robusta TaxID=6412 RepID=T1FEX3_HELRO|nr:hypothetical protein HELRODRAFT_179596 [Helobdella robusta]ESN95258.1 hypothetical protein HELRODRAFT_179596 [Helobdella robusta]
MINYILIVNRLGQPRLRKYFNSSLFSPSETNSDLRDVIKLSLGRDQKLATCFKYKNEKILCRKYFNLLVIVSIDDFENEIAIYEFIHMYMSTLNDYFNNKLLMMSTDKCHMILEEIVSNNGRVVNSTKDHILSTIRVLETFENQPT